jgi:hypothetical protein
VNPMFRLRAALAAALLMLLAACGPGVGGTGTGAAPDPGVSGLQYFGATPQNVCLGPLANALGCAAVGGSDPPTAQTPRHFATDCAVASFSGDAVELDALCSGWFFSGRWGLGADGGGRYHGLVGPDPLQPPTHPATLEVQVQGADLLLTLRAADGQVLVGPLLLSPVPGTP